LKIGGAAFEYCDRISSVILGQNIEQIDDEAFYYCEGLLSVEICCDIGKISEAMFYGCKNLDTIRIYPAIDSFEDFAFYTFRDSAKRLNIHLLGQYESAPIVYENTFGYRFETDIHVYDQHTYDLIIADDAWKEHIYGGKMVILNHSAE